MKISLFSSQLDSADYLTEMDAISFDNLINEAGYYSVLFVYHSQSIDYWLMSARSLNRNHSFKYMFAIRTYAISPEYCAMLVKSFNRIQKNRLALNIVAGDIHGDENSVNNSVMISDLINTTEKRTLYTGNWLDKFIPLIKDENVDIVISGYSENTNNNAEKYGDEQLCMLSTYLEEMKDKIKSQGKMVSIPIYFNDKPLTQEENNKLHEMSSNNSMVYRSMISGNELEIIEKILLLEDLGITHCLLSMPFPSQEKHLHDMSKKLINRINRSK